MAERQQDALPYQLTDEWLDTTYCGAFLVNPRQLCVLACSPPKAKLISHVVQLRFSHLQLRIATFMKQQILLLGFLL